MGMISNQNLENNYDWKQYVLKINNLIFTLVSYEFGSYTLKQKELFNQILNTIEQLNLYLEVFNEPEYLYFTELKTLFELLPKLLNIEHLIIAKIAKVL